MFLNQTKINMQNLLTLHSILMQFGNIVSAFYCAQLNTVSVTSNRATHPHNTLLLLILCIIWSKTYRKIFLPNDSSKSLPTWFKSNLIKCARNCSELVWIDRNQLEDNTSGYSQISLNVHQFYILADSSFQI